MISRLRFEVADAVRARGLWAPGARVGVAVSGGLDSVCLLDLLVASQGVHGGRLEVITIDHGTRPDSAADADFVASLAQAHALPLHRHTLSLGPDASEAACRQARFRGFADVQVDVVALAHHRDDQVESVLLALLRGAGSRGQGGMRWRRGRYVRPLLDLPRSALQAWAAHRGLTWRDDPTNTDPRYLRNRLRALLPELLGLREGSAAAIARGAALRAEDDALLHLLAAESEAWRPSPPAWSRAWVASAPAPLVRRCLLQRLSMARSAEVGAGVVEAVMRAARRGRGRIELSSTVAVVVGEEWVLIDGVSEGQAALLAGSRYMDGPA